MEERINYAKQVTNTSQIVYDSFNKMIIKNLPKFKENKVIIFGAGVRGTLLSIMLCEYGVDNIYFTDNNKKLYGGYINEFPILSLEEIVEQYESVVILVSPENSGDIIGQLMNIEAIEDKSIVDLGNKLYECFMEQYKNADRNDIFIVGDCGLLAFSLYDKIRESLGVMIKKELIHYKTKQLEMNGMGMRAFYNILCCQLKMFSKPQYVFISINLSTFNGKQHFLPNTQHVDLIKKMIEQSSEETQELQQYLKIVQQRYNSFKKSNVIQKANISQAFSKRINEMYLKMNYMYKLNLENEELSYLIKIIDMLKEKGIIPVLFVLPINYCQGKHYFGNDFKKQYCNNSTVIQRIVEDKGFELLDLSFLLGEEFFPDKTTIEEAISYEGRCLVRNEIIEYFYDIVDMKVE